MKLRTLINKLKKIEEKRGNVDVLIYADNGPYAIWNVDYEVAAEGDYPKNYNMPEGYKFVQLSN